MKRRFALIVTVAITVLTLAGCGGDGSASNQQTAVPAAPPNLAEFLKLPVATPSACPSTVSGSTAGRRSVWAGHVDVSVFLSPGIATTQTLAIGNSLRSNPLVEKVYFESSKQAYEEFQRLYTCWANVPKSQTPASYRVVLDPTVKLSARNALVAQLARETDVDSVSCDPSLPCTSELPSPSASPTG